MASKYGSIGLGILICGLGACGGDDSGGGASSGGSSAMGGNGGTTANGGTTSSGGSTSAGGSTATGGSGQGGSGNVGQGGSGGGGECPSDGAGLSANKITIDVSWPGSLALAAGSGQMVIWNVSELNFDGTSVTGTVRACGSMIPPLTKSAIAGGGRVQTVIPDAAWDAPGMPTFQASGTISGFDPGATIAMQPVFALVGTVLNDPANDPWPDSWMGLTTTDPEGNGKPGIVANPRNDGDFGLPPTSIAQTEHASQLGLATRTAFELMGTRTSCDRASGSVTVHAIDSHVVHCTKTNGQDCANGDIDFIDGNQPSFSWSSATYEMVQIAAGSTCADVRAALP